MLKVSTEKMIRALGKVMGQEVFKSRCTPLLRREALVNTPVFLRTLLRDTADLDTDWPFQELEDCFVSSLYLARLR